MYTLRVELTVEAFYNHHHARTSGCYINNLLTSIMNPPCSDPTLLIMDGCATTGVDVEVRCRMMASGGDRLLRLLRRLMLA